MKKILLTNHYGPAPYSVVSSVIPDGFELIMLDENSQECLMDKADQADYLLASGRVKITDEFLEKAVNLKMIQRTGVGLDSLDLKSIRNRNIPLYVNQGVNAQSVAEHSLLLILACMRRLTVIHKNTSSGIWKKQDQGVRTSELSGKTIGLIGMGNIAQTLVRLLSGFETEIIYYDPFRLDQEKEKQLGIRYAELKDVISGCDILSLHCPLNEGTKKIVNAETISLMKDGAALVNTARGGLVDTNALASALENGKISFAGLDVFETEPVREDDPLLNAENVILTPHIGGITRDSFYAMMHDAMRNIEKYEKNKTDEIECFRFRFPEDAR